MSDKSCKTCKDYHYCHDNKDTNPIAFDDNCRLMAENCDYYNEKETKNESKEIRDKP